MLSGVAALGALTLFERSRALWVAILLWYAASSAWAHPDYLPKLPTEFEVATLKPVDTSAGGGRGPAPQPTVKNGRLFLPNFDLNTLIQIAWDVNGDEFLINAPKWLKDDHYCRGDRRNRRLKLTNDKAETPSPVSPSFPR
jgi:hypothetical protein